MRDMTTAPRVPAAVSSPVHPSAGPGARLGTMSADDTTIRPADPSFGRRTPMPTGRYRALIGLAVAVAVLAIVLGVRATQTGSHDPVRTPDVVEHLVPGS